jgi:hypothetical protein
MFLYLITNGDYFHSKKIPKRYDMLLTQRKVTPLCYLTAVVLAIVLLCTTLGMAYQPSQNTQAPLDDPGRAIVWDVLMSCATGGYTDSVTFGEATDGNDGPPADAYDVPKPLAGAPPYVRAWFNDNLPNPYDELSADYRQYPDTSKIWTLTVEWMPSSGSDPVLITLSWDISEVDDSEYSSVTLCTLSGAVLSNMLLYPSYTFSCPVATPQVFTIRCRDNSPPVANPDSYTTKENFPLSVATPGVLGNDVDTDGDPLTAELITSPTHGFVTLSSNGSFLYTPVEDYLGADMFSYRAFDGLVYSDVATVTITIRNYPPIANDDKYIIIMESDNNTFDVLADDIDPEGGPLTLLSVQEPLNGTIRINGSIIYYTPDLGFFGFDRFNYTISDNRGQTDTAEVHVVVREMQSVVMFGTITNVTIDYNFTTFNAKFLLALNFNTASFNLYLDEEYFVVSSLYFGWLTPRFILGLFLLIPSSSTF